MNTMESGTATWRLLGITNGRGACDHCGRSLARLFRIANPDGREMTVGRACSAKMTGYNWSVAQAERAQRHADALAEADAKYPELHAALRAQLADEVAVHGVAGAAGEGLLMLRSDSRYPWVSEEDAVAFATRCLTDANREALSRSAR